MLKLVTEVCLRIKKLFFLLTLKIFLENSDEKEDKIEQDNSISEIYIQVCFLINFIKLR